MLAFRSRLMNVRYRNIAISVMALACVAVARPAWGQRDLTDIPDPDPELQRQSFLVDEAFEVNLFVSDPDIAKPIQMNFDAQGRLWIASSSIYPHIKPGQQADDKILVVEDADGDGRAEKTTVFADGLLIPTGVLPGDDGVYVANSTELIHLKDADGDGRADQQRVVLSGFGTEDTHHLLHTLRWGPDGAIYMNQSIYIHSHVETPYGVRRLNGGGIWRFRPDTLELDVLCRGFVNPWGHHIDRWGQSFATDGAYTEGINYVFPGSVFVTAPDAERFVAGLNPGSPKHCGLEILSGRHLPPELDGQMITNDFRAHRVCRFEVTEDGAGYSSRQHPELIKTDHVAFRPIDVKMGPDGAIYIADWYNPIIQHGEVDFRDERRDQKRGRIWRVTAKGRDLLKPLDLRQASSRELLEVLKQPEQWNRLHAKLILRSRGAAEVLPELRAWLAELDQQDPDSEHHRLEALWLHQCVNVADEPLLASLLQSSDHRVRAAAMRVVPRWRDRLENTVQYLRDGVHDEHPRVRLEAVRGLAEIPSAQSAAWAAEALDQPVDRFLDFAIWQTMRDLESHWLPEVVAGRMDFGGDTGHLIFALEAVQSPAVVPSLLNLLRGKEMAADETNRVLALVGALGGPQELSTVLDAILQESEMPAEHRANLLLGLVQASQGRNLRPAGDLQRLDQLIRHPDESLRVAAIRAAGAWRVNALEEAIVGLAVGFDSPQVTELAIESLGLLGTSRSVQALRKMALGSDDAHRRAQAIASLSQANLKMAADLVAHELASASPASEQVTTLVSAILQRKQGPAALTAALETSQLPSETAKLALRAARATGASSAELESALQRAGNLQESAWQFTPELTQRIIGDLAKANPARGETIYRREELQCIKCHAIGGAGGSVGPDLASLGASSPADYIVESLLAPNAKIKENFHSLVAITDDGLLVTGIPVRESDSELVLRDAEDKLVVIPKESIEERMQGRSLMPDGAVNPLTYQELVDLTRFLTELGKVGDYAVGSTPVARHWETLVWTQEGHQRLNRTSFDTAATADSALTWRPEYSLVSGALPLDSLPQFQPHQHNDPTSFVRAKLNVKQAGPVTLVFDSGTGLSLWVDGEPTPMQEQLTLNLSDGLHQLTLAINRRERDAPVRLELEDAAQAEWQAAGGNAASAVGG